MASECVGECVEDQRSHTAVTSQNGYLKAWSESRGTLDRAGWRRLVRCATRAADHHSRWDREKRTSFARTYTHARTETHKQCNVTVSAGNNYGTTLTENTRLACRGRLDRSRYIQIYPRSTSRCCRLLILLGPIAGVLWAAGAMVFLADGFFLAGTTQYVSTSPQQRCVREHGGFLPSSSPRCHERGPHLCVECGLFS